MRGISTIPQESMRISLMNYSEREPSWRCLLTTTDTSGRRRRRSTISFSRSHSLKNKFEESTHHHGRSSSSCTKWGGRRRSSSTSIITATTTIRHSSISRGCYRQTSFPSEMPIQQSFRSSRNSVTEPSSFFFSTRVQSSLPKNALSLASFENMIPRKHHSFVTPPTRRMVHRTRRRQRQQQQTKNLLSRCWGLRKTSKMNAIVGKPKESSFRDDDETIEAALVLPTALPSLERQQCQSFLDDKLDDDETKVAALVLPTTMPSLERQQCQSILVDNKGHSGFHATTVHTAKETEKTQQKHEKWLTRGYSKVVRLKRIFKTSSMSSI